MVEITMANIPVRDPERIIAIAIKTKMVLAKYFSIIFPFLSRNKAIGNPNDKTAANPAGLSKLPVIEKLVWFDDCHPIN